MNDIKSKHDQFIKIERETGWGWFGRSPSPAQKDDHAHETTGRSFFGPFLRYGRCRQVIM